MPEATARTSAPAQSRRSARAGQPVESPFFGMLDPVLVESPVEYVFDGAVPRADAQAAWMWLVRDIAPDLIDIEIASESETNRAALDSLMPELLQRANDALRETATSAAVLRKIKAQLGTEEAWERLPTVLNVLRGRALLDKAQTFGRAANGLGDEMQLIHALHAMPLQDQGTTAILMMAMVGQVTNPGRLVMAAIRIAGGATEAQLMRAGLAPLVDAVLAHAQDQLPAFGPVGVFGDMDRICRAVDRFHRLMRSVTGFVELNRGSRWASVAAAMTRTASERLDPGVRSASQDVNLAMRRREGMDRLDAEQMLAALNGMYLLATVRDCRESLALNAIFDQVWAQVGQTLEIQIERNLEVLRRNPADKVAAERLEGGIKMAELRYNADYADVLRRAKDAATRRIILQG